MSTSAPGRVTPDPAPPDRVPGERRPRGRRVATVAAGTAVGGLLVWGIVAVTTGSPEGALEVPGEANVFGAGIDVPPAPGGGGGGEPPVLSRLPDGEERVVTFPAVGGRVTPIEFYADEVGPAGDGGRYGTTDLESFGGISGVEHRENGMFLVGVFLTEDPPQGEAPPRLDVTDVDTSRPVEPEIGQTFLIGDGEDLRVAAPDEATRLFLGFADGHYYQGAPGWYDNNAGSVTVTVAVDAG